MGTAVATMPEGMVKGPEMGLPKNIIFEGVFKTTGLLFMGQGRGAVYLFGPIYASCKLPVI
jgi:hypothetical protein